MKSIKIIAVFLVFSFLASCSEDNIVSNRNDKIFSSITAGTIVDHLLDGDFSNVYGIQIYHIDLPSTGSNGTPAGATNALATSVYRSSLSELAEYTDVKCNNVLIPLKPERNPVRNFLYCPVNSPIATSGLIQWQVQTPTAIIETDCPMPETFGNVEVNNNSPLVLSSGATLTWGNSNSAEIVLEISFHKFDVNGNILDQKFVATVLTENDGSYELSSNQLLGEWEIPTDASYVNIKMIKANVALIPYDNDTKKMVTACMVTKSYRITVE